MTRIKDIIYIYKGDVFHTFQLKSIIIIKLVTDTSVTSNKYQIKFPQKIPIIITKKTQKCFSFY